MILMIDNYDSFTYNLVQYMGELGAEIRVERNDCISISEIESMGPKKLLFPLDLVHRSRQVFQLRLLSILLEKSPCWEFVLVINLSVLLLEEKL